MKFDYTSDLHLDFHFNPASNINSRKLKHVFDSYFFTKSSDYLLIAGDIGHYPKQNLQILNMIKEEYGYKDIFTVEGNHSGYLVSKTHKFNYKNGKEKILDHMEILENGGIKILNGNTYSITDNKNNIIIGGANSWYDGSIFYHQSTGWYNGSGNIETHWKNTMNDSKYMKINDFYDIVIKEKEKLTNLQNKCDVIVTHVKPVIEQRYFQDEYKHDITNAYYSFDWGEKIANDEKLKVWVYGHTHVVEEWDFFGKKLLCNAYGYPKEMKKEKNIIVSIKNFEI